MFVISVDSPYRIRIPYLSIRWILLTTLSLEKHLLASCRELARPTISPNISSSVAPEFCLALLETKLLDVTGTRSSVVPSEGLAAHGTGPVPMQAVIQKHEERSTEKVTEVTASQTHIVTGNGTCSKLGTEGGHKTSVLTRCSHFAQPCDRGREEAGIMGTLVADSSGHGEYTSRSYRLRVWDIIDY
ncbi:hypothetical protein R1flu_001074 [Riccia fluitans]|uniref:Uncharacterized protein n=1 Tax=Riccia fluitans TaxID=41844 RepID=A0ABD1Y6A7_9MARC